ncbi:rhodanese-like domain-containing protein [Pseudobacteriovorax antillogorgiicola]|uniref:Rhodanese-related sulfurtransferase n=1 Tax=Pseudobacteriovorax antillogorgiicola TaxID=1513793 RepID=A0A1Y6BZX9_9BACT|nr:rhodanese-like domain-containing protein [Pseudobacteriovorax antillogorgiicola]TCS52464.1 rhodanese-related sulfurtransferase [Pseudobacteriovorax antillogorgiicola]SMF28420.1 Rhodanese-related sulfurtransferase [Pseudobacteriovorax antillogorgiicola]
MKLMICLFVVLLTPLGIAQGLEDYNPKMAKKMVTEQGALLLDVRSDREYKSGSLPGAKHLPHHDIRHRADQILKWQGGDKSKPIVVFCAVGGRANRAKAELVRLGFSQVTNMGGLKDWPK